MREADPSNATTTTTTKKDEDDDNGLLETIPTISSVGTTIAAEEGDGGHINIEATATSSPPPPTGSNNNNDNNNRNDESISQDNNNNNNNTNSVNQKENNNDDDDEEDGSLLASCLTCLLCVVCCPFACVAACCCLTTAAGVVATQTAQGKRYDAKQRKWVIDDLTQEELTLKDIPDDDADILQDSIAKNLLDDDDDEDDNDEDNDNDATTNNDIKKNKKETKVVDTSYYDALGVSPTADEGRIKRAYYVQARKCHPDKHPDDEAAKAKFQTIGEAYAVLSDPSLRKQYDRKGIDGLSSDRTELSPDSVDPSLIFTMLFGNDLFTSIVGRLQVVTATIMEGMNDSNNNKNDDDDDDHNPLLLQEMREQQAMELERRRVIRLALALVERIDKYVRGLGDNNNGNVNDNQKLLQEAQEEWKMEAQKLVESSYGEEILHLCGQLYKIYVQANGGTWKDLRHAKRQENQLYIEATVNAQTNAEALRNTPPRGGGGGGTPPSSPNKKDTKTSNNETKDEDNSNYNNDNKDDDDNNNNNNTNNKDDHNAPPTPSSPPHKNKESPGATTTTTKDENDKKETDEKTNDDNNKDKDEGEEEGGEGRGGEEEEDALPQFIEIMWSVTVIDITSCLREVVYKVLNDRSVDRTVREKRALAIKALGEVWETTNASTSSDDEDDNNNNNDDDDARPKKQKSFRGMFARATHAAMEETVEKARKQQEAKEEKELQRQQQQAKKEQ